MSLWTFFILLQWFAISKAFESCFSSISDDRTWYENMAASHSALLQHNAATHTLLQGRTAVFESGAAPRRTRDSFISASVDNSPASKGVRADRWQQNETLSEHRIKSLKRTDAVRNVTPQDTRQQELKRLDVAALSDSRAVQTQSSICSYSVSASTTLPQDQKCTAQCPFSQQLPGDLCHKVCIPQDSCALFHPGRSFAEPESKLCMPICGYNKKDQIVGCSRCAGVGRCAECKVGFTLVDNGSKCQAATASVMPIIYVVLGVVAIMLTAYVFLLVRRPTINEKILALSLRFREHCRNWKIDDEQEWTLWPMKTSLLSEDIGSGHGIILYFRWLIFAMVLALLLFAVAYGTYAMSAFKQLKEANQIFDPSCSHARAADRLSTKHGVHHDEFVNFSLCMFFAMSAVYIIVVLATALFQHVQRDLSFRYDESTASHEDYAVLVEGLPEDATEPAEIVDFFQRWLGNISSGTGDCFDVVGVSIAYDYKEHADLIDQAICQWVEELEWRPHHHLVQHRRKKPNEKTRKCCSLGSIARLEFLDLLFWGSCADSEESNDIDNDEITKVLKQIKGSGSAYVIVTQPAATNILVKLSKFKDAPLFRDRYEVRVKKVGSAPPSVFWENFTEMNFWPKIVMGILLTGLTIALWMLLYLPTAVWTGSDTDFLEGTLLGLLISLGNIIVAKVIGVTTGWAGFRHKDRRDVAILSLAFLSTLLNTVCDIWMLLHITSSEAQGGSVDFDSIVAKQAYAMIVPGYLILPYLVAPVVENVIPYYMGVWFVRSRRASLRASEECLKCDEFDICWRYSDVLNNFTVCSLMLFIVSPETWKVMLCLVGFLLLIYFMDTVKLLRQSTQTFYTTSRLDNAASVWMFVPTGILAAVTVWWACRAEFLPMEKVVFLCCGAFCMHFVVFMMLHELAFFWICPKNSETTEYHDMCYRLTKEGKLWSYFNTNPVFCLRSYLLSLKEPGPRKPGEVVPYIPGKQHLQPGVPQHFLTRHQIVKKEFKDLHVESTSNRSLWGIVRSVTASVINTVTHLTDVVEERTLEDASHGPSTNTSRRPSTSCTSPVLPEIDQPSSPVSQGAVESEAQSE